MFLLLVFVVTTVDSGYKALEFLGLRQGIESNDTTALSLSPQVRKSLLLSFEKVSLMIGIDWNLMSTSLCVMEDCLFCLVLTFDRK